MATGDFLPTREVDLLAWSAGWDSKINALPGAYGLTSLQAAQYNSLHRAFQDAWRLVNANSTRTPTAIVAKNIAKRALIAKARELAGIVQKFPGTTNTMRCDLKLSLRNDELSPIPAPDSAPVLSIASTVGTRVKIRLRGADNPYRRGKPPGIAGAIVLIFVGDHSPGDRLQWSFLTCTTKTDVDLDVPTIFAAGSKLWLTAFWYNAKAETGTPARPVSTRIADGLAAAA